MNKPILLAVLAVATALAQPKLYVMDCGTIAPMNPQLYDLKAEEIKGPQGFFTPCYLIVHPRGTLVWDVGQIPDENFPAGGGPVTRGSFTATKKLLPQLAEIGYVPAEAVKPVSEAWSSAAAALKPWRWMVRWGWSL